jgi:ankyrin repeat protein
MSGLIWLIVVGTSIWLLNTRKSMVAAGELSELPLTRTEKAWTWVLCFLNPLITGGILYYGWRKKLPVKAKQANRISFMIFGLQLVGAILFMTLQSRQSIFIAVRADDVKGIKRLLSRDPGLANMVHHGDGEDVKDGETPLCLAAAVAKNKETVETLLEHGAKIDAPDAKGRSPLGIAVGLSRSEIVGILLAHHASVNHKDNSGITPLHYSAFKGDVAISQALLNHGADINILDGDHQTPLLVAVAGDHREMVDFLLKRGARTNIKNHDGDTALSLAEQSNFQDIAKLLRNHGAV